MVPSSEESAPGLPAPNQVGERFGEKPPITSVFSKVSSGPGGHGRSQRSRALTPGGPEKEKLIQPGGIIIPQNKCPGYVASTRKGTAPWGSGRRQILDLGWESAFLTRPVMLVLQDLSYIREAGASP